MLFALAFAGLSETASLLDGGLRLWIKEGLATAPPRPRKPVKDFLDGQPGPFPLRPDILTGTEEVERFVRDGHVDGKKVVLADVRAWREHIGVGHEYTFISKLGRIPRSTWVNWGVNTYSGTEFFTPTR